MMVHQIIHIKLLKRYADKYDNIMLSKNERNIEVGGNS